MSCNINGLCSWLREVSCHLVKQSRVFVPSLIQFGAFLFFLSLKRSIADPSHAGAKSSLGVSVFNYPTPLIPATASPLRARRSTAGEKQQNANFLADNIWAQLEKTKHGSTSAAAAVGVGNKLHVLMSHGSFRTLFLQYGCFKSTWSQYKLNVFPPSGTSRTAYVKHSCQR